MAAAATSRPVGRTLRFNHQLESTVQASALAGTDLGPVQGRSIEEEVISLRGNKACAREFPDVTQGLSEASQGR